MTEKKLEKIGIDHGFRNMKTRNCVFDTALSKLPQKPDDLEGVLEYNNDYYCIYGRRITSVDTHNKADSDEFYLLTLAAIAKELKARKTHIARIYLSVGLPQKMTDFIEDLRANAIGYEYLDELYYARK